MPASNVAGYTKRVTATAFVFLAYCIGNIIGPHAFLAEEAPVYQTGCKVIIACTAGQVVLAILLRLLLTSRNARRNKAMREEGEELGENGEEIGELNDDFTDFDNRKFRYNY